jgi:anti-sigma regulatory factor (Ser/Thr protein kinase)
VSELVTNAVLHSEIALDDELRLDVEIDDDGCLRVTVTDSGRGFEPKAPDRGDESGWGLFIVDRLAHSWGVERGPDETRVWFQIGVRESSREDAPEDRAAVSTAGARLPRSPREHEARRGPMARLGLGAHA